MTTARTMPAKYETHCCLCDRAVRKGNVIRVIAGEPTVHATCHEIMLEGRSTEGQIARWTARLVPVAVAPVATPSAAVQAFSRAWGSPGRTHEQNSRAYDLDQDV